MRCRYTQPWTWYWTWTWMTIWIWQSTSHENGKHLKHIALNGERISKWKHYSTNNLSGERNIHFATHSQSHFMWLSFRLLNAFCKVLPSIFSIVLSSSCHLTQALHTGTYPSFRSTCATIAIFNNNCQASCLDGSYCNLCKVLHCFDNIFNFHSSFVSSSDLFSLSSWTNIK